MAPTNKENSLSNKKGKSRALGDIEVDFNRICNINTATVAIVPQPPQNPNPPVSGPQGEFLTDANREREQYRNGKWGFALLPINIQAEIFKMVNDSVPSEHLIKIPHRGWKLGRNEPLTQSGNLAIRDLPTIQLCGRTRDMLVKPEHNSVKEESSAGRSRSLEQVDLPTVNQSFYSDFNTDTYLIRSGAWRQLLPSKSPLPKIQKFSVLWEDLGSNHIYGDANPLWTQTLHGRRLRDIMFIEDVFRFLPLLNRLEIKVLTDKFAGSCTITTEMENWHEKLEDQVHQRFVDDGANRQARWARGWLGGVPLRDWAWLQVHRLHGLNSWLEKYFAEIRRRTGMPEAQLEIVWIWTFVGDEVDQDSGPLADHDWFEGW